MGARMHGAGEEAYLDKAIRRYSPEIAATARADLRTGRGQVVLKSRIAHVARWPGSERRTGPERMTGAPGVTSRHLRGLTSPAR